MRFALGIASNGAAACARLYRDFGPFGSTMQIARQGLYIPEGRFDAVDEELAACGIAGRCADLVQGCGYADERLFPAMGAHPVSSIDASSYEGATHVHDLNLPVPDDLHLAFDTVIEAGTLEHIFHVPNALASIMRMLKVGGRVLHMAPANDWLGHGMYQFSPELYFRIYQPENGFRLKSVALSRGEIHPGMTFADLGVEGGRNEIGSTGGNAELIVVAEKIADVIPFSRTPQQGDYQAAWDCAAHRS
jgi:SAM-dependent methyltransferase